MPNAIATVPELVVCLMEMNFSVRKVLRWLIYVGSFVIPLLFLPFTTDILDFNKSILLFLVAGVGLVLFMVDMVKEGILRYRANHLYWAFGALMLAALVSVIASMNPYLSLFGSGNAHAFSLVSLLSFGVLFFLAMNVIEDGGLALRNVLVASLSLSFVIAALQMIGINVFSGPIFGRHEFNTVGSLSAIGFLAAAFLPVLLISPRLEKAWQSVLVNIFRIAGLIASMLILVVLNWSYLWIVAFVSVLGYIAFTSFSQDGRRKMTFLALPMAVVVIGSFLWAIDFNWTAIKSNLPIEVSMTHRISYGIATDSLKTKPLGWGLESYVIGYDKLRPPAAVNNALFQARFLDSTSEVATMGVEGGFPLLIAFLAFLVLTMRELWGQFKNRFDGNPANGKVWASVLALLLVFFFYPVNMTMLLALVLLLVVGVLGSSRAGEARVMNLEDRSAYSLMGSVGFIVGLVAVLIGGYFMVNQYIANVYVARAAAVTGEDKAKAAGLLVKSINSYPQDTRAYRGLSQVLIERLADDLKVGAQGKTQAEFNAQVQDKIASAVNVAVRATNVDPSDSENWVNRGFVYQNLIPLVNGSHEAAISMYREGLVRSPANALVHVRIGNIHLALADEARRVGRADDFEENLIFAEQEYAAAIALYNNYGQALYNLAVVYERKGELPEAIKQFERLQNSSSRDPSILFQLGLLYYRNNQKDNALRVWEQAVLSFPNYSNARWYLSLMYEERNDLKRALAQVEAIEEFNKDNTLVQERLEFLRAGLRQFEPPEDVLDQTPLNNEQ